MCTTEFVVAVNWMWLYEVGMYCVSVLHACQLSMQFCVAYNVVCVT